MSNAHTNRKPTPVITPARTAGALLLVTAAFTVAMIFSRLVSDTDQPTLLLSLQAVMENRLMYALSGITRLLSIVAFLASGLLLLRTWIIRERWATPLVPYMFVVSGGFTVASGASAILIAAYPALDTVSDAGVLSAADLTVLETASSIRWLAGKVGFAMAGAALMVASRYQWRAGGVLRRMSPVSAILGVAMQFIWVDGATIFHPVVGTAFILWLLAVGGMLSSGRVERQFITTYGKEAYDDFRNNQRQD